MWILFILVLLGDKADSKWAPYDTPKECEAAKADVIKKLAAVFPAGEATVTCFYTQPPGKLS